MTDAAPSDYRLSAAFSTRLVGLLVVGLAVVVLIATLVVAAADLHTAVLLPVALLGLAAVFAVGAAVRRTPVLHLDEDGYRIRLLRGAGVTEARWADVKDAVADSPHGVDSVVLRLQDGRTSTIPVEALEVDRAVVVQDLRRRLQRGHGLTSLD